MVDFRGLMQPTEAMAAAASLAPQLMCGDLLGSEVWLVLHNHPGMDQSKVFRCHAPHRVKSIRRVP